MRVHVCASGGGPDRRAGQGPGDIRSPRSNSAVPHVSTTPGPLHKLCPVAQPHFSAREIRATPPTPAGPSPVHSTAPGLPGLLQDTPPLLCHRAERGRECRRAGSGAKRPPKPGERLKSKAGTGRPRPPGWPPSSCRERREVPETPVPSTPGGKEPSSSQLLQGSDSAVSKSARLCPSAFRETPRRRGHDWAAQGTEAPTPATAGRSLHTGCRETEQTQAPELAAGVERAEAATDGQSTRGPRGRRTGEDGEGPHNGQSSLRSAENALECGGSGGSRRAVHSLRHYLPAVMG